MVDKRHEKLEGETPSSTKSNLREKIVKKGDERTPMPDHLERVDHVPRELEREFTNPNECSIHPMPLLVEILH